MAAGNLFATHFTLSHLDFAELSVLLNSMELNTGVSSLGVSNQTSLISEAFTVSFGDFMENSRVAFSFWKS